jgi:hypothetical protein
VHLTLVLYGESLRVALFPTVFAAACCCLMLTAVLLPGFLAKQLSNGTIAQAQLCPQGYFCLGAAPNSIFDPSNPGSLSPSEPSIKRCGDGM